jgi:hypothetical protein
VIAESAYVDAAAVVIGEVSIGTESSVWPNTVVRGDVNSIMIGNIKIYREIIFTIVLFFAFLGIIYLLIDKTLEFSASKNNIFFLNLYPIINKIMLYFFDLLLYGLVFLNRISFYDKIKKFHGGI